MNSRPRVKICGIRTVEEGRLAIAAGAHAVAVNFVPSSKRYIRPEDAREILLRLPPFVAIVGVFANEPRYSVEEIASFCRLQVLQFHGDESPDYCRRWSYSTIKAFRLRAAGADATATAGGLASWEQLAAAVRAYDEIDALLLDTDCTALGGSGRTFDWSIVRGELGKPIILGGGLTPENVGAAVTALRPYGVDVASGVETDGRKDWAKALAFVRAVEATGIELDQPL